MNGFELSALWGAEPWWVAPVSFLLGAAAGSLVAWVILRPDHNRRRALEAEIARLGAELAAYREQVGQHFRRSAELINGMTAAYRAVYEHLAQGAHQLCTGDAFGPALELTDTRLVGGPTTEQPGARRAGEPHATSSAVGAVDASRPAPIAGRAEDRPAGPGAPPSPAG